MSIADRSPHRAGRALYTCARSAIAVVLLVGLLAASTHTLLHAHHGHEMSQAAEECSGAAHQLSARLVDGPVASHAELVPGRRLAAPVANRSRASALLADAIRGPPTPR